MNRGCAQNLRIIGGAFRNHSLQSPKGGKTRPTLAIMRKAVFDILQNKIKETRFLDLYAGTGAMGLEALSRGASHATFVEAERSALLCIEENIQALKVESKCSLIRCDCFRALKTWAKEKRSFDVVYADPPYAIASRVLQELLAFFAAHPLLEEGGTLFLEEAIPQALQPETLPLGSLRLIDTRSFSRSALHQFLMTG